MGDQGFDFQKAPERREPKRFEPPPWEKAAFEELQRAKEADEVTEAIASLEVEEPQKDERAGQGPEDREATVEAAASSEEGAADARPTGVSEGEVLELLAGLAAQEPDPRGPATAVTIAASVVLTPIGMVLLVWGMVAFVKAGEAVANAGIARTGAATMMIFGAGFIASAFWLMYRLMKQRGVL